MNVIYDKQLLRKLRKFSTIYKIQGSWDMHEGYVNFVCNVSCATPMSYVIYIPWRFSEIQHAVGESDGQPRYGYYLQFMLR